MSKARYAKDRALDISVVLINGEDEEIYLDDIVKSVSWSGDVKQASRKLDVSISNTVDGKRREFWIELGGEISFRSNGEEVFHGVVFADRIDNKGQMTITAYDENIYLTKSKDSKKFVGKTASAIISSLCTEFGVPAGKIEDTGFVIPKLILRDKTLWEMMVTALTVTYRQTGRRFFIFSKNGKLQVSERKNVVAKVNLERGLNILDATFSSSIEEMKTKVKVTGEQEITTKGKDGKEKKDKKEIEAKAEDAELIKRFGIMQHLENMSGNVTPSQIQQRAKELLKQFGVITDETSLNCFGVDEVISGSAVYAYEPMTGIAGSFYVSSDTHNYSNGVHTMSINITATDDLPLMEYEPPEEPEEKKKKSKKKKKGKNSSSVVDLIFNAKGV
jgi:hypothetical protein